MAVSASEALQPISAHRQDGWPRFAHHDETSEKAMRLGFNHWVAYSLIDPVFQLANAGCQRVGGLLYARFKVFL